MKTLEIVAVGVLAVIIVSSFLVYTTYGSGILVIRMKDPPDKWGQAEAVYITFSDIMIHRADAGNESGWFSTGVSYSNLSLLQLVNISRILGERSLQVGLYNVVRFNITQAIVTVNEVNYTCTVESGKLNVPITEGGVRINGGQTTCLEIDINPTVTGRKGDYKLTPAATASPG